MSNPEFSMTIDMKWNRIRIHKRTIRAIGSPGKVLLLVNPAERAIILTGTTKDDPAGHAPSQASVRNGKSFELHSKPLITQLGTLFPAFSSDRVYRFIGKIADSEKIVRFSADDVVDITDPIAHE